MLFSKIKEMFSKKKIKKSVLKGDFYINSNKIKGKQKIAVNPKFLKDNNKVNRLEEKKVEEKKKLGKSLKWFEGRKMLTLDAVREDLFDIPGLLRDGKQINFLFSKDFYEEFMDISRGHLPLIAFSRDKEKLYIKLTERGYFVHFDFMLNKAFVNPTETKLINDYFDRELIGNWYFKRIGKNLFEGIKL
jgi:hypothetical protein